MPRWGLGFEQYSSRPITRVSQDGVVNVFRRLLLRRHAFPPILPGLHFAAVEAEKVEALPPIPDIDHLGFRRMERQPQTAEDDLVCSAASDRCQGDPITLALEEVALHTASLELYIRTLPPADMT